MKKMINTILPLFTVTLLFHLTSAAMPEDWEVDLAAQPPQVFTLQRPRGETYELKAVLKRHGKPFEPAITNACIYWQTNGMENLYWSAPASVSNNVLRATWLPSMDPGATTVRGYIGDPGHIYAAAFQFRFIASPGATPNELPLPQKVIDFAKVTVLNPPWSGGGGGGGVDTNAVEQIANTAVETNAVTVGLQSSVSSLQSSKLDANNDDSHSVGWEYGHFGVRGGLEETTSGIRSTGGGGFFSLDGDYELQNTQTGETHKLSEKANKYVPSHAGNIAALDENGDLSDSNVGTDERGIKIEAYGGVTSVQLNDGGVYVESYMPGAGDVTVVDNSSYPSVRHDLSAKADRSMIHHTNTTFSNEVAEVVRTIQPTAVRAYDRVRRCWWVLEMVNGVPTWTVED